MSDSSAPSRPALSRLALFRGFLTIGMNGFGGVGPVARHVIVEDRKWMTEQEFAVLRGYGTVLPGPNVMNMAVMIGYRNRGIPGAVISCLAILLMPIAIMLVLATLFERYRDHPMVAGAVYAMAAASGGLIVGTGLKMAIKLKFRGAALTFATAAVLAVGVARLSLPLALAVLLPASIAVAVYRIKRP